jgi:hypothetical protein
MVEKSRHTHAQGGRLFGGWLNTQTKLPALPATAGALKHPVAQTGKPLNPP